MKIYYKIVRIDHEDKLRSCVVMRDASIEYVVDKWVKAPKWLRDLGKGPLVFTALKEAKEFASIMGFNIFSSYAIYECRARGVHEATSYMNTDELDQKVARSMDQRFPRGTLETRQVKLIRQVY